MENKDNRVYLVWLHYPGSYSGSLIAVYNTRENADKFIKLSNPDIRRSLKIQEMPVLDAIPDL